MGNRSSRDVEKGYSTGQFVVKLRRPADAPQGAGVYFES